MSTDFRGERHAPNLSDAQREAARTAARLTASLIGCLNATNLPAAAFSRHMRNIGHSQGFRGRDLREFSALADSVLATLD